MSSPTVVLVHGAFADASSWSGVIAELQAAGVNVAAPPNQLRGIPTDAAYLTSFVNQLGGPTLLVGHSYGGALHTSRSRSATYGDAARPLGGDWGSSDQEFREPMYPSPVGGA